jgi:hypothetical protein
MGFAGKLRPPRRCAHRDKLEEGGNRPSHFSSTGHGAHARRFVQGTVDNRQKRSPSDRPVLAGGGDEGGAIASVGHRRCNCERGDAERQLVAGSTLR